MTRRVSDVDIAVTDGSREPTGAHAPPGSFTFVQRSWRVPVTALCSSPCENCLAATAPRNESDSVPHVAVGRHADRGSIPLRPLEPTAVRFRRRFAPRLPLPIATPVRHPDEPYRRGRNRVLAGNASGPGALVCTYKSQRQIRLETSSAKIC